MNKKIFEILVCPVCKGKLIMKANELICKIDRLAFPVREDIPVMLVSEARAVKSEEIEELS